MDTFNEISYPALCQKLSASFQEIGAIEKELGFPPLFQRDFNFQTLVQIILEQQVSLASANAAFVKLKNKIVTITPEKILSLDTAQLRTCSVSRQKAMYLLHLAEMINNGILELANIPQLSNEEVRAQLMQVKGIGPWTADIVLMLCLSRTNIFPIGDIALVNSMRYLLNKPDWTLQEIESFSIRYEPYKTIATYFFWHAYIERKNIKTY